MLRTIAAAVLVFAFAAFSMHYSEAAGRFEEPLLLLMMGTLFLVMGKVLGSPSAPTPVAERQAA
jgi:hypothetical protein